ncbi:hypothetical protein EDI_132820 [Entamoeba dispar SAW760]|uniref:Uncharacterized protein n=1 Tax=Entamoeba dispar (strain ATCC PRA-260 / SAW760) TaxID=370354 RepID=B0EKG7_ENTDS|nr:uncharacterized protein EDI_132820 [Entamoeba dispar SAW760]EDR24979.1 hypothetical protein EDI_132820 [Entamoeba dispar SAW760]|eukprot:EDR24979.1 hypothetical protein EDI_132820 [Entamoeba dispar SAW760]
MITLSVLSFYFVITKASYYLTDTTIEAHLTYSNSSDFQYDFNVNTACCLVSRTTPECSVYPSESVPDITRTITYDYKNNILRFSNVLPQGVYEVWIYQHKGAPLYGGLPIVEVTFYTSQGLTHQKYIINNIADTNNQKYVWWNVFTIRKNSTGILLRDFSVSRVSKEVFISPPSPLIPVQCDETDRDINGVQPLIIGILSFILLLIL